MFASATVMHVTTSKIRMMNCKMRMTLLSVFRSFNVISLSAQKTQRF